MIIILKILNTNEHGCWNKIVKSFKNWDVYYLYEYAYSFFLHGDGNPLLIYFENNGERFCYVVMQNDIYNTGLFGDHITKDTFFDWETPYGYGGPLCDGMISPENQKKFLEEIFLYTEKNNVISQFVRFHPLLSNYKLLNSVIETRYLRDTIYIDTSDKELIIKNMDSKNRNMVRKAIKSGVCICEKCIDNLAEFNEMYKNTMKRNSADQYYIFDEKYFNCLTKLRYNASIFYAALDEKLIAGSIIFYNERYAHYHLSGSDYEYRKYSPSNLLLYEVAKWACEKGIKMFHLGGGMSPNDSLFGFKKQFNTNGYLPFVVGRTIFNKTMYNKLIEIRTQLDSSFNRDNSFMIQYRR